MINLLPRSRYPLLAALSLAMVLLWPGVRAAVAIDNNLSIWFLEGDQLCAATAPTSSASATTR